MRAGFLILLLSLSPVAAEAGVIERACLSSARASADRSLCGCIQQAANRTLSPSDQRRAARFFENPDQAQKVRMSNRRSDEVFWERYQSFGAYAEAVCAR